MCFLRSVEKKVDVLKKWFDLDPDLDYAGCLLIGCDAFRSIVFNDLSKKLPSDVKLIVEKVAKYLLKPGKSIAPINSLIAE